MPQHECSYPVHCFLYGTIRIDPLRIKTIWILLELLGLKEEDTTERDLSNIGDRILCTKCQDGLGKRMYWTGAVSNLVELRYFENPIETNLAESSIFFSNLVQVDHAMTVHRHERNPPAFKLGAPLGTSYSAA